MNDSRVRKQNHTRFKSATWKKTKKKKASWTLFGFLVRLAMHPLLSSQKKPIISGQFDTFFIIIAAYYVIITKNYYVTIVILIWLKDFKRMESWLWTALILVAFEITNHGIKRDNIVKKSISLYLSLSLPQLWRWFLLVVGLRDLIDI